MLDLWVRFQRRGCRTSRAAAGLTWWQVGRVRRWSPGWRSGFWRGATATRKFLCTGPLDGRTATRVAGGWLLGGRDATAGREFWIISVHSIGFRFQGLALRRLGPPQGRVRSRSVPTREAIHSTRDYAALLYFVSHMSTSSAVIPCWTAQLVLASEIMNGPYGSKYREVSRILTSLKPRRVALRRRALSDGVVVFITLVICFGCGPLWLMSTTRRGPWLGAEWRFALRNWGGFRHLRRQESFQEVGLFR